MKFATLIVASLVALAQGAEVATNGDCSASGSTCASSNCCGTATPTAGSVKKICYTSTATSWTDTNDNNKVYQFACPAATSDAKGLAVSTAAIVAGVYMLA